MSIDRAFAIFGSLAVVVAVISGLYIGGSPGEQRLLRFDERRVSDLRVLSRAIERRWEKSGHLPEDLAELVDGQRLASIPSDPQKSISYVYEPTSTDAYRLCAEFSKPDVKPQPKDFWAHESGYQCFEFSMVDKNG